MSITCLCIFCSQKSGLSNCVSSIWFALNFPQIMKKEMSRQLISFCWQQARLYSEESDFCGLTEWFFCRNLDIKNMSLRCFFFSFSCGYFNPSCLILWLLFTTCIDLCVLTVIPFSEMLSWIRQEFKLNSLGIHLKFYLIVRKHYEFIWNPQQRIHFEYPLKGLQNEIRFLPLFLNKFPVFFF